MMQPKQGLMDKIAGHEWTVESVSLLLGPVSPLIAGQGSSRGHKMSHAHFFCRECEWV